MGTMRNRGWNLKMVGLVLILIMVLTLDVVNADVRTGGLIPREVHGEEKSRDGLGRHRESRGRSGWQKKDRRSVLSAVLPTTIFNGATALPSATSSFRVNQYLAAEDITLSSPPDASSPATEVVTTIFSFGESDPTSSTSTTASDSASNSETEAQQSSTSYSAPPPYNIIPTTSSTLVVPSEQLSVSQTTEQAQAQESSQSAPAPFNVVPTTSSTSSDSQPSATEGPPVEVVPGPVTSSAAEPAPQASSEPALPPPSAEPSADPATEAAPSGPVETTLIPTPLSFGVPSTVLLTSTGEGKAVTITRTANDGVLETVITGPAPTASPKTGTGGMVTFTSMSGSEGTSTAGRATVTDPTAGSEGGTKTHTVIINPSAAIRKVIPFVIEAKEGDTVEFLVYKDVGGDGDSGSGSGSGSESGEGGEGEIKVERMRPGVLCEPLARDSGSTDDPATTPMITWDETHPYTVPASSSSAEPILLGSTEQESCTAGMMLLINPLPASPSSNASEVVVREKKVVFADGAEVRGGTIGDVLTTWGGMNSANAQALAAFSSSPDVTPTAWAWGQQSSVAGLEGYKMDDIVQNILYTRLTLALNPSLLELYIAVDNSTSNKTGNGGAEPTAVTQITAFDSFLTSLIGSSTATYGGNAGEMSTGAPWQAGPGRHNGAGAGLSLPTLSMSLCMWIALVCSLSCLITL